MNSAARSGLLTMVWLALVAGCAAPGYVKVNKTELQVESRGKTEIQSRFVNEATYADPAVEDWDKVADLANLTGNTDKAAHISKPTVSPTQDAMVFYQFGVDASSLYRQSLGSQARSPLASSGSLDMTPAFTPKGDYLVFSSNRTGLSQGLWRIRSDGAGGITQLTSSVASFDLEPSVAADGETIVFQSYRSNLNEPSIWSVSMNGGLLTLLADGQTPRVSPDGRRVAFVRTKGGSRKQIWLMNIDGSGQTQLTNTDADNMDPSWHPNGRVILFASNAATKESGRPDFDIWMMKSDGTAHVQLTQNFSHDDGPMFEKNGRVIVFRSNRGGFWNLYSFQPDLK